jgi:hypothetical protein
MGLSLAFMVIYLTLSANNGISHQLEELIAISEPSEEG